MIWISTTSSFRWNSKEITFGPLFKVHSSYIFIRVSTFPAVYTNPQKIIGNLSAGFLNYFWWWFYAFKQTFWFWIIYNGTFSMWPCVASRYFDWACRRQRWVLSERLLRNTESPPCPEIKYQFGSISSWMAEWSVDGDNGVMSMLERDHTSFGHSALSLSFVLSTAMPGIEGFLCIL